MRSILLAVGINMMIGAILQIIKTPTMEEVHWANFACLGAGGAVVSWYIDEWRKGK